MTTGRVELTQVLQGRTFGCCWRECPVPSAPVLATYTQWWRKSKVAEEDKPATDTGAYIQNDYLESTLYFSWLSSGFNQKWDKCKMLKTTTLQKKYQLKCTTFQGQNPTVYVSSPAGDAVVQESFQGTYGSKIKQTQQHRSFWVDVDDIRNAHNERSFAKKDGHVIQGKQAASHAKAQCWCRSLSSWLHQRARVHCHAGGVDRPPRLGSSHFFQTCVRKRAMPSMVVEVSSYSHCIGRRDWLWVPNGKWLRKSLVFVEQKKWHWGFVSNARRERDNHHRCRCWDSRKVGQLWRSGDLFVTPFCMLYCVSFCWIPN